MNIKNIECDGHNICGKLTIDIPFRFKAKRKGSWMVHFGGHTILQNDSGEHYAEAWPENGDDYRIYFKNPDNDNLELHIQPSEIFDEKYILGLLQMVQKMPEAQEMIKNFNEKEKAQEREEAKKREEVKKKLDEQTALKELEELEMLIEEEERLLSYERK